MQRLRDSRDAAKDTAEKWRAQVRHYKIFKQCLVPWYQQYTSLVHRDIAVGQEATLMQLCE